MGIKDECIFLDKSYILNGYSYIKRNGKTQGAHRYFYEQINGEIPKGLVIDHLCRNRGCVNVNHLEIVTQAENVRRGDLAKLSKTKAKLIRKLYKKGIKQIDLAKDFGVDQSEISRIINNKRWYDPKNSIPKTR